MTEKINLTAADNFHPIRDAYYYNNILHQRLQVADRDTVIMLHKGIDHYSTEYNKARAEVGPISAAVGFHDLMDQENANVMTGQNVTCRKGCSFCCLVNVDLCLDEAQLLLEYSEEKKVVIDWDKVERQEKYPNADRWVEQSWADRRCVFLNDAGECQVYEHRPAACRNYAVLSPVEKCDPKIHPDGEVQRLSWYMTELIDCGMQNARFDEQGNMPTMLMRAKHKI